MMLYSLPINYRLIRQKLLIRTMLAGSIVCLGSLYFREPSWVLSAMLGTCFGYVLFTQLVYSQCSLLKTKRKDLFLLQRICRLGVCAAPILVSVVLKNYFNLYILLIFLLSFKVQCIGLEFSRSYRKYKKRVNHGSIR